MDISISHINYFKISLNSLSAWISFLYVLRTSTFVITNTIYSKTTINCSIIYRLIALVVFIYSSKRIYSKIIFKATRLSDISFYSNYFFYFTLPYIISNAIGKQFIYYLILIIVLRCYITSSLFSSWPVPYNKPLLIFLIVVLSIGLSSRYWITL